MHVFQEIKKLKRKNNMAWAVEDKEKKIKKPRVNFTIDKTLNDNFSTLCEKELRKKSNVVEDLIKNYVSQRSNI